MKPRSWAIALLSVSLVIGVMFWRGSLALDLPVRTNQKQSLPEGALPINKPIRLADPSLTLTPRYVGVARSRPDADLGAKIAAGFASLLSGKGEAPEPLAPLDPSSIDATLLPKAPKLSPEQQAALTKLRWGLAKDLRYRGDGNNATVRSLASAALAAPLDLKNPLAESADKLAKRFIDENRALFLLKAPEAELALRATEDDGLGGTVVRFTQRYDGIEVWPAQLTANVTKHGYLTVVTGAYAPTPEGVVTTPMLTPEQALENAAASIGASSVASVEVHSAPQLKIYTAKEREPELSYEVVLESGGTHERIFVSALTGDVLLAYSEICSAATTGSGVDVLGVARSLNVFSEGTPVRYFLRDRSKAMFNPTTGQGEIKIIDAATDPLSYSSSASQFAGYDREGVSAAHNLGKIYDFYRTTFGRNSYDSNGAGIIGIIRKPDQNGEVLHNAYWNGKAMFFGLGDRYTASSDVVAHEFTHAVISNSAGLVYRNDSGAINESFADIFGESFEAHLFGSNDWRIGSQLTTYYPSIGGALRSMDNPESGDQPRTMSGYVHTTEDNGGVHINSGIPNHAFYLIASGLASGGIGINQARDIFYRALTCKLNRNSDFYDLRAACVLSAEEIHGLGSTQANKVREAFDYVQIYDRSALPAPSDLTPTTGIDAYLIAYEATNGSYYLGRREAAMGDGASITSISGYAMDRNSRPTVTADGSVAGHVTAAHNLAISATNGSGSTLIDFGGAANALSISADGKYLAVVPRNSTTGLALPQIIYSSLTTSSTEVIDLYLPVADGPNSITINSVDEVDLSPDGQYALFDGLAETQLPGGGKISGWTIFLVDLKSKAVTALTPSDTTFMIGNPSFARTSTQRFVFELSSSIAGSHIAAVDFGKDLTGLVRTYSSAQKNFAYPRYSAADNFIVFVEDYFSSTTSDTEARVASIGLLSDKVTPTGSPTTLQSFAINGLSYRRGTFAGAPVISISTTTPTVVGGSSGSFRIARESGDRAIEVAVSFKATGTAQPAVDYLKLTPIVTIPAGQTVVEVPVASLLVPGSATKALTLTLDPLFRYVLSTPGQSATITLTAPPDTYSYWASQNNAGAAIADDDGDGFPNLLEYAIDADPKSATPASDLAIRKASGGLLSFAELRLRRKLRREGITFTLQSSSDNTNWTNAGTAVVTDSATELVLRDSLAVQSGKLRRFRIIVGETASNTSVATKTCYWAGITIENLTQSYDGLAKAVSVTTDPTPFTRTVTYDGSPTPPVNAGSYSVAVVPAIYSNLIGEASATLIIGKADQTISFPALLDRKFTDTIQSLSASASSGLPVGFTLVSGQATVNGTQLTLTGIGSVTIRAHQAGDSNYAAALPVDRTFTTGDSFDWWRNQEFTPQQRANPAISGASAAPSSDGLTNLLKYALGLNALQNTSTGLPTVTSESGRWSYTYTRPADRSDLTYAVEISTDLATWTSAGVTHEMIASGASEQTWRASYPSTAERVFFRLKVVRP